MESSWSRFKEDALRYDVKPTERGAGTAVDTARYAEDVLGLSLVEACAVAQLALANFEDSPLERAIAVYAEAQS